MSIKYKRNRSKYRGSRHCGWGTQGQHRKTGKHGGKGMTGLKKHKASFMVKYAPDYYGKHGFNRPVCVTTHDTTISIKRLESSLASLEKSGAATKKGTLYDIDLAQAGFTKLLSTGSVNGKYNITVARASAKATEKIKAAGGSVTLTAPAGDSE